jgi:hypothetical protein
VHVSEKKYRPDGALLSGLNYFLRKCRPKRGSGHGFEDSPLKITLTPMQHLGQRHQLLEVHLYLLQGSVLPIVAAGTRKSIFLPIAFINSSY